jgi:hypothetical protein
MFNGADMVSDEQCFRNNIANVRKHLTVKYLQLISLIALMLMIDVAHGGEAIITKVVYEKGVGAN